MMNVVCILNMLWIRYGLLLVAIVDVFVLGLVPHQITFMVISQKDSLSAGQANQLRADILAQSKTNLKPPKVLLSHEYFSESTSAWAITPLILDGSLLATIDRDSTKWLVVCESQSRVNLSILVDNLKAENHTAELYLGHGLRDYEATIVHHFAFFEDPSWFRYPYIRAGVAFTIPLLISHSGRKVAGAKFASEFVIDAAHELSMFLWNGGNGQSLKDVPYFCVGNGGERGRRGECAIFSGGEEHVEDDATCKATIPALSTANIFVAVKTCSSFHQDRIPIIQNTWAPNVEHIRYYSDSYDDGIPTINTGVENTETGHCQKMLAIFHLIADEIHQEAEWIVLVDDDTLLSIPELIAFLRNFDGFADNIYVGERYGYRLYSPDGFNYVTGGGGIVFSRRMLPKLIATCVCPTHSAPDDMILGLCMRQLHVKPTHSDRFHQARPVDYSADLLTGSRPISFHKYWQIDPYAVYTKWLAPKPRSSATSGYTACQENHSNIEISNVKSKGDQSHTLHQSANNNDQKTHRNIEL